MVGQPAAQDRPHGRRQHHPHAVDRHGHALLFLGEGFPQDGLGYRDQGAAAHPLQDAVEKHLAKVDGRAAQNRAEGEQPEGQQVEAFAADQGAQPARHGYHDDFGDAVGGGHPGDRGHVFAEGPHHVRQGHVDHVDVHDRHERPEKHGAGHQPLVDRGRGGGGPDRRGRVHGAAAASRGRSARFPAAPTSTSGTTDMPGASSTRPVLARASKAILTGTR